MAEKKKKRVVRQAKPETVREKAARAAEPKPKKRTIASGLKRAGRPFKSIGSLLKKIFRPFRFLLRPFKTKPGRMVGRGLAKIFLINYFIASWQELKQVEWPSRKQTIKLSTAVFLFAIGLTGIIAGTDWVLDKIFRQILLR